MTGPGETTNGTLPPLAVLGVTRSERVSGFRDAVRGAGSGSDDVNVIDWAAWLTGRASLTTLAVGTVLRVDSPGDDPATERLLIRRGGGAVDDRADPTRIGQQAAWYRGFIAATKELIAALPAGVTATTTVHDLAVMFDKRRCHQLCVERGIAVPAALDGDPRAVTDWTDLRARMAAVGRSRVFLKPAHGSAASGVIALATAREGRVRATAAIELVRDAAGPGGFRLHNTKRVRTLCDERDVAAVVNALAAEHLHVEAWVPKATFAGGPCDLRVIVLGGRAHHVVPRIGRSPLTNLHLGRGNVRGDAPALKARAGDAAWNAMLATCEQTASLFPDSLLVAVDVAFTAHFRGHRVLEVNAFGDWLRRVTHNGRTPWQAWIDALPAWLAARERARVSA